MKVVTFKIDVKPREEYSSTVYSKYWVDIGANDYVDTIYFRNRLTLRNRLALEQAVTEAEIALAQEIADQEMEEDHRHITVVVCTPSAAIENPGEYEYPRIITLYHNTGGDYDPEAAGLNAVAVVDGHLCPEGTCDWCDRLRTRCRSRRLDP